jgi:hypothetical protein
LFVLRSTVEKIEDGAGQPLSRELPQVFDRIRSGYG